MQIVNEIGSPRIRQLADFYHMAMGREDAESIVRAGDALMHCHVAHRKTRYFPGAGDTAGLRPYFDALLKIGYHDGVSCECSWKVSGDERPRREKLAAALAALKALARQ
jgi:sugar phosphate isomerase/epimerase